MLGLLIHPAAARADNWPAWRGPQGTGVAGEGKPPPLEWDERRNVRWRAALPGRGNSTPVVWSDRVFVTQAVDKDRRRTLMCFNRADGALLWQSGVTYEAHEPTNGQNPYCSGSPVTDGTRVIAYFGSAGVYCYDFAGKELWRADVGKADSWHGSGSSPVLHGDLCIVNAGPGTESALVALDKATGKEAWRVRPPKLGGLFGGGGGFGGFAPKPGGPTPAAEPPAKPDKQAFDRAGRAVDMSGAGGFMGSWSTPLVVRVGDRDELVVSHASKLAAYDPATSKELWTCAGMTEQVFSSPTAGEGVLVAAGKRLSGGTTVLAVKLDGTAAGDVTATHRLWTADLPKDCVGSPVITGGYVYMVTQFGSAVCLDLATGGKVLERRLSGSGSAGGSWSSPVLAAGGRLLIPNQSGEVFVLDATPKLDVLATNVAREEVTCASPVVCGGQVFLRTHEALWCFEAR